MTESTNINVKLSVQIQVWRLVTPGSLTPRNDPGPSPRPEVSFPPAPPPYPITNGGSVIEKSEVVAMVTPPAVVGMFRLVAQKTMTMDYAGNVTVSTAGVPNVIARVPAGLVQHGYPLV